jgi:hypothetical protein
MHGGLVAVMGGAVLTAGVLIALGLAADGGLPPAPAAIAPSGEASRAPTTAAATPPPIIVPLPSEAEEPPVVSVEAAVVSEVAPVVSAPVVSVEKTHRQGRTIHRRPRERGLSADLTLNPFRSPLLLTVRSAPD